MNDITFLELDDRPWFDGPPPSSGWWPASINRRDEVLRWWNGIEWSFPVDRFISMEEVVYCAALPSKVQDKIQWTFRPDSWPERSKT